MRRSPLPALALGLLSAVGAAASTPGAAASLAIAAAWALLERFPVRHLMLGLLPVLGSLAFLGFALPFAPRATLDVALRSLAVSVAVVMMAASVRWPAALAVLQALRVPRALVAFLAILAANAEAVREDVLRAGRGALLRGGFDGTRNSARTSLVLLAVLLPAMVEKSEAVADALELRGFVGRVPSVATLTPRRTDLPVLALTGVALLSLVLTAG